MKEARPSDHRRLLVYSIIPVFRSALKLPCRLLLWRRRADNKRKTRARFEKGQLEAPLCDLFSVALDSWKLLTGQGFYSASQDECRVLLRLRGCTLLNLSLSPF